MCEQLELVRDGRRLFRDLKPIRSRGHLDKESLGESMHVLCGCLLALDLLRLWVAPSSAALAKRAAPKWVGVPWAKGYF